MTAKGAPLKLGKDMVLAEKIEYLIVDNHSPYAGFQTFKNISAQRSKNLRKDAV